VCSVNWKLYCWESSWKFLGSPYMNSILGWSSPYTFPQASPMSRRRAAKASGTSRAPREARFTSDAACFRVMGGNGQEPAHRLMAGCDSPAQDVPGRIM